MPPSTKQNACSAIASPRRRFCCKAGAVKHTAGLRGKLGASLTSGYSQPGQANNRDRGEPRGSAPPTPPYVRVRTRRFGGLSAGLGAHGGPLHGRSNRDRRAVGCSCRHAGFGPFEGGAWGFTPHLRPEGQHKLVFHRLVRTRSPSFLPTPPFGPAVIAPPAMPSADFWATITDLATRS